MEQRFHESFFFNSWTKYYHIWSIECFTNWSRIQLIYDFVNRYIRAIIFRKDINLLYVCVTVQCESTNKTSKPTPSRMLPMRCLKKWILEYLIKNVGTKSAKFFFQEEILIWYYLKWCSFSIANLKLIKYIHPEKSSSSYKTFILYIYSFCL